MTASLISVVAAEPAEGLQLRLRFEDGTQRLVDFAPFLRKSIHPDISKWLEPAAFSSYRIVHGDLVWGDYELCFPVADLYRGVIE
ncbi:MAG: hypothetical protein WCG80_05435 [Spirochaetales bacterium]